MKISLFAFLLSAVFMLLPIQVEAALVPIACSGETAAVDCGTCEFVQLINNVIQFIITLATIIATIMLVVAGFRLVTSGGDVSAKEAVKKSIANILIGFVLILAAFLIVNTILSFVVNPDDPKLLNWQTIECLYPNTPEWRDIPDLVFPEIEGVDFVEVNPYETADIGGGTIGRDATCSVPSSGSCAPSNLTCFDNPEDAAQVCSTESGGNAGAISGTDRCKDGSAFSFGLWQINVMAHYDKIPGCSKNFFESDGPAQGSCIFEVTNSNGVEYCKVRNCKVTDSDLYKRCVSAVLRPETNTQIACRLYNANGWQPWETSAGRCNVQ